MNMKRMVDRPSRIGQRGLSLISVLVAIVIFGLGMLSIASLYSVAVPAQTANQEAVNTAAFGNQFWALLQADPAIVGDIGAGTSATYTASNSSGAPAALQPWLYGIFTDPHSLLPGASVIITTGNDANGNACTAPTPATTDCGVTLTIAWNGGVAGGGHRSQTYQYQVGF